MDMQLMSLKLPLKGWASICRLVSWFYNMRSSLALNTFSFVFYHHLQTEHIDNPKGYADGEDARKYHPQLRGPVDPRELEIDMRSGMKNYIANGMMDTFIRISMA